MSLASLSTDVARFFDRAVTPEQLERMWEAADNDHSGTLCSTELSTLVKPILAQVTADFAVRVRALLNPISSLTDEEAGKIVTRIVDELNARPQAAIVTSLFRDIDKDRSGSVSKAEFLSTFNSALSRTMLIDFDTNAVVHRYVDPLMELDMEAQMADLMLLDDIAETVASAGATVSETGAIHVGDKAAGTLKDVVANTQEEFHAKKRQLMDGGGSTASNNATTGASAGGAAVPQTPLLQGNKTKINLFDLAPTLSVTPASVAFGPAPTPTSASAAAAANATAPSTSSSSGSNVPLHALSLHTGHPPSHSANTANGSGLLSVLSGAHGSTAANGNSLATTQPVRGSLARGYSMFSPTSSILAPANASIAVAGGPPPASLGASSASHASANSGNLSGAGLSHPRSLSTGVGNSSVFGPLSLSTNANSSNPMSPTGAGGSLHLHGLNNGNGDTATNNTTSNNPFSLGGTASGTAGAYTGAMLQADVSDLAAALAAAIGAADSGALHKSRASNNYNHYNSGAALPAGTSPVSPYPNYNISPNASHGISSNPFGQPQSHMLHHQTPQPPQQQQQQMRGMNESGYRIGPLGEYLAYIPTYTPSLTAGAASMSPPMTRTSQPITSQGHPHPHSGTATTLLMLPSANNANDDNGLNNNANANANTNPSQERDATNHPQQQQPSQHKYYTEAVASLENSGAKSKGNRPKGVSTGVGAANDIFTTPAHGRQSFNAYNGNTTHAQNSASRSRRKSGGNSIRDNSQRDHNSSHNISHRDRDRDLDSDRDRNQDQDRKRERTRANARVTTYDSAISDSDPDFETVGDRDSGNHSTADKHALPNANNNKHRHRDNASDDLNANDVNSKSDLDASARLAANIAGVEPALLATAVDAYLKTRYPHVLAQSKGGTASQKSLENDDNSKDDAVNEVTHASPRKQKHQRQLQQAQENKEKEKNHNITFTDTSATASNIDDGDNASTSGSLDEIRTLPQDEVPSSDNGNAPEGVVSEPAAASNSVMANSSTSEDNTAETPEPAQSQSLSPAQSLAQSQPISQASPTQPQPQPHALGQTLPTVSHTGTHRHRHRRAVAAVSATFTPTVATPAPPPAAVALAAARATATALLRLCLPHSNSASTADLSVPLDMPAGWRLAAGPLARLAALVPTYITSYADALTAHSQLTAVNSYNHTDCNLSTPGNLSGRSNRSHCQLRPQLSPPPRSHPTTPYTSNAGTNAGKDLGTPRDHLAVSAPSVSAPAVDPSGLFLPFSNARNALSLRRRCDALRTALVAASASMARATTLAVLAALAPAVAAATTATAAGCNSHPRSRSQLQSGSAASNSAKENRGNRRGAHRVAADGGSDSDTSGSDASCDSDDSDDEGDSAQTETKDTAAEAVRKALARVRAAAAAEEETAANASVDGLGAAGAAHTEAALSHLAALMLTAAATNNNSADGSASASDKAKPRLTFQSFLARVTLALATLHANTHSQSSASKRTAHHNDSGREQQVPLLLFSEPLSAAASSATAAPHAVLPLPLWTLKGDALHSAALSRLPHAAAVLRTLSAPRAGSSTHVVLSEATVASLVVRAAAVTVAESLLSPWFPPSVIPHNISSDKLNTSRGRDANCALVGAGAGVDGASVGWSLWLPPNAAAAAGTSAPAFLRPLLSAPLLAPVWTASAAAALPGKLEVALDRALRISIGTDNVADISSSSKNDASIVTETMSRAAVEAESA